MGRAGAARRLNWFRATLATETIPCLDQLAYSKFSRV